MKCISIGKTLREDVQKILSLLKRHKCHHLAIFFLNSRLVFRCNVQTCLATRSTNQWSILVSCSSKESKADICTDHHLPLMAQRFGWFHTSFAVLLRCSADSRHEVETTSSFFRNGFLSMAEKYLSRP